MKTNMHITPAALAALLTFSVGCKGQQPEPFDGTPRTSAAMAPLGLGLGTYLSGTPTAIAFDLDSRFQLTVTKEQLRAARTIHDIVPGHLQQDHVSYTSVRIRAAEGEGRSELGAVGNSAVLDQAQLELLWSLDYSDNFMIGARSTETNAATGVVSRDHFTPHVTIVPEHEAENSLGREAMIAHVRSGTSAFAHLVDAKHLRPGRVHFTVDKEGTVSAVRLSGSSGYPLLDEQVLELVNTLPGTWKAATNAAGQAVEQEFVFSFGAVGC